jgi:cytochrome c-type biogenesis protein CcmH
LQEQSRQLQAEHAAGLLNAEQYEAARLELARRTLQEQGAQGAHDTPSSSRSRSIAASAPSRRSAWVLALSLPLLAFGLYTQLGTPEALAPGATQAAAGDAEVSPAQVEAMVAIMRKQLEQQPPGQADPAGWAMLARTLASLQRFEEADRAYARAIELAPRNAQWLADRADLLMLLQSRSPGGAFTAAATPDQGDPQRLIAQALKIDPDNLKALALAGSVAFEAQDFKEAIAHWSRARKLASDGSPFAQGLDESLAAARSSLGQAAPATQVAAADSPKPLVAAGSVSGNVRLAPALQARLDPKDTLYIFARVAGGPDGSGPRMPVAILRLQAKDLPLDFKLDDSLAMSPDFKLSGQTSVLLQARVSRSGQAMPQSGDLIGQTGPVKVGAAGVVLVIDAVQP